MKDNFKFRQYPKWLRNTGSSDYIKISEIIKEIKVGGFRMGNLFASIWFGGMLFFLQSYFLKQNLKPDTKFISD
jgi:hypothetical protein